MALPNLNLFSSSVFLDLDEKKKYHVCASCLELLGGQGDTLDAIGAMTLPGLSPFVSLLFLPGLKLSPLKALPPLE